MYRATRKLPPPNFLYSSIIFIWRTFLVQDEERGKLTPLFRNKNEFVSCTVNAHAEQELLSIKCTEDLNDYSKVKSLWEKIIVLFTFMKRERNHLVCDMIVANFPPIIVWFALRLCPEWAKVVDCQNVLPLIQAMDHSYKDCLRVKFTSDLSIGNTSMLRVVLDAFPAAARHVQSWRLSLPLAVLLRGKNGTTLDNVEALIRAEPRALSTRDLKSRFYPFIAAAQNNLDLDIIYTLISANPMAVSGGIKPSHHEVYLKAKLEASQSELARLRQKNQLLAMRQAQGEKELVALRKEIAALKNSGSQDCPVKRSACTCNVQDAKRARVSS